MAEQRLFWIFMVLTTLARLAFAAVGDLKVEEAYYWDYAQHPALSYFDHPPLTPWLIALSTSLGGSAPLWVRLPAILLFVASSWLVFDMVRRLAGPRQALLSAVLMSALPTFSVHGLLMLPDSPLLFCWCLGIWAGWRLVESQDNRWWWVVGLATGLGLDAKYPALLIPLGLFLYLRQRALCAPMFGAALLAMAMFTPVIAWNASHDWASIRFQGAERIHQALSPGERASSWLLQLAMLSPAGFFVLVWGLWKGILRRDAGTRYLLCWSLPFLGLMVLVSLRRQVQMNWPLPGYVAAAPLLALALVEAYDAGRRRWAALLGLLTLLPAAVLSFVPIVGVMIPLSLANPGDDLNNWSQLAQQVPPVLAEMPHPKQTFLAGHGYQVAAELAHTLRLPHLTLSNNILGQKALAFDYWEDPAQFKGWDALYLVYLQPRSNGGWRQRVELDPAILKAHFARVEDPEIWTTHRGGAPLRQFYVYRCFGYQGP